MKNLHYLFNTEYYKDIDLSDTAHGYSEAERVRYHKDIDPSGTPAYCELNQEITNARFESGNELIAQTEASFVLETGYPGLLIGLGALHQAEKHSDQIILGFTLDPVTGLPYIPGSSIKGAIRSAFKKYCSAVDKGVYAKQAVIFGSDVQDEMATENQRGAVIFYDAFPIKPGKDGRLVGLENITPHKVKDPEYEGLKNPIPLTLLKVIPGVQFLFRFDFRGEMRDYPAKEKMVSLFKEIIINLGIGAKTNVGFGRMKEVEKNPNSYNILIQKDTNQATNEPTCQYPGCNEKTKINKKTGKPYPYCMKHRDNH